MDWVKQVQFLHGSYCGAYLLCGMCVKDNSLGFGQGFFLCISCVSSSSCGDGVVSSEGG